jgi:hypothetical protein
VVLPVGTGDARTMNKRIIATVLWFLAGWYATAMLAESVGLGQAIAPFVGAAVGTFVAMDPLGLFWARPASTQTISRPDKKLAGDRI